MARAFHYRERWDGQWLLFHLHPTKGWRAHPAVNGPPSRSFRMTDPAIPFPKSYPMPQPRKSR